MIFLSTAICKKWYQSFYIHVYPFFTMCTAESFFSFRFFPSLPPIQFVMNVSHSMTMWLYWVIHRFTCPPLYDVHILRESLFVIFAKVKFKLFSCVDPLMSIFCESIEFLSRLMNVNTIAALFNTQHYCETQMSASCVVLIYFQKLSSNYSQKKKRVDIDAMKTTFLNWTTCLVPL